MLPFAVLSAVLVGGVCAGPAICAATGAFSCALRRLRGERSSCRLSDPVGDLDPDLQTVTEMTVILSVFSTTAMEKYVLHV